MSNQFLKLRRSSVPGKIPTTSSLEFGEIALNTYDGLAFMKKSGSAGEEVVPIGVTSGSFTGSLFGTASWALNVVNGNFPNILNTVTVGLSGSTGVDYNSIKTALDTITDANANNPYAVIVSPGVYIEDTMNVPQYVIVKGDSSTTTIVSASNPNNRIFNMSDQSMLIDMQVQGSTGTGVSAIYYSSSTTPQTFAISYVENVRFGTNYTNATCEGLNGANIIMQCSNVKYGGYTSGSKSFDVGFVVTGSNSGIGRMQLRNVTSTNGGITGSADQVFALANGPGCTFIVNGCLLTKSVGAARGTGFLAYNGASLRLTAVNFQRWEKAIYMPNTGSAPSIFGSALNFENDTYDLLVEHPSATGKVDGLDTFLKSIIPVNAPLYEVNQDPKRITVAKKGGDFSSISASVAWITDSAETNRYVIEVGPGKFIENEIDLRGRPYVSIVGSNIQTTEIFPSSSNQHIVRMGVNNEISFLSLNGAGPGYAAIYVDDIGDFAQAHKVSIYDSDIGIKVNASTVDTQFYGEYIDINGTYTYGLYVSSSNTIGSFVNMENFYQFPVSSPITANYVVGPYSSLTLNSTLLQNDGTTNTIAFELEDGAVLEASSLDIQGFDTAYYIPDIGLGPNIRASGVMIHDSLTYDFNNENASSNVRYDGIIDGAKIVNNSPTVYWNRLDDVTGQSYMNSIQSTSVTASFLGNLEGTASWALNTFTASYVQNAVSAAYASTASWAINALTASSADNFVVRGNITGSNALFTGTITAQTLNVQYVTASTELVTGSTKFGTQLTDTHQFTGSVSVTGSLTVNGPLNATSSWASNALTASYVPSTAIIGDLSRIATASFTASVNSSSFQITSASSNVFNIDNGGQITVGGIGYASNTVRIYSGNTNSIVVNRAVAGFSELATFYDASGTNAYLNINAQAQYRIGGDTILARDSANVFAQRNGIVSQSFRIYNTYTSLSDFERGKLEWSGSVFQIGTEKSGSGTARALEFQTDGTTRLTIAATGLVSAPSFAANQNLGGGINIFGIGWQNGNGSYYETLRWDTTRNAFYSNNALAGGVAYRRNDIAFYSSTVGTSNLDLIVTRDGAGILAQRSGSAAQTFRIYNTFTDVANFERGKLEWSGSAFYIGTEQSGSGVARDLALQTSGSTRLFISSSGNVGIGLSNPIATLHVAGDGTPFAPATAGSSPFNGLRVGKFGFGVALDIGTQPNNSPVSSWIQSRDQLDFSQNRLLSLQPNGGNVVIGQLTDSGFKLDVSGSARITNGLIVTGSSTINNLTGSLFGTASWALNAVTASFVPSSGVVGDFSRIATGSVTASVSVVGDLFTLNDSSTNYIRVSGSSNGYVNVFSPGNVNISASNNNSVILAALSNNGRVDISSYTHSRILNRNTTTGSFITNFGIVPSNGTIAGFTFDSRISGSSTRTVYRFNVQDSFPDNFTISYIGAAGGQRGGHVSLYGGVGSSNVGGNVYIAGGTGTSPGNVYLGTDYRDVTSSVDIRGNVIVGGSSDLGYKLYVSGSGVSGSLNVNNTLLVSGSIVSVTGSLNAPSITGSLFGTSSWAQNAATASYVTASNVYGPFGSNSVISSSFALTASFALNAGGASATNQITTGSVTASVNVGTSSFQLTSASVQLLSVSSSGLITGQRMFLSASQNTVSGSTLTVYGSGSAQPVFTVQGSQGELFSVSDSLSGSLFSVNDISGLPIVEVFSDNRTLIGSYQAPALITTVRTTSTIGNNVIYQNLPTASYDGAFFDYTLRSGSNARAGQIVAMWSGSSVNFTETTTTDFGDTSGVRFGVIITGSNMALTGSFPSASWTMKTIIRSI